MYGKDSDGYVPLESKGACKCSGCQSKAATRHCSREPVDGCAGGRQRGGQWCCIRTRLLRSRRQRPATSSSSRLFSVRCAKAPVCTHINRLVARSLPVCEGALRLESHHVIHSLIQGLLSIRGRSSQSLCDPLAPFLMPVLLSPSLSLSSCDASLAMQSSSLALCEDKAGSTPLCRTVSSSCLSSCRRDFFLFSCDNLNPHGSSRTRWRCARTRMATPLCTAPPTMTTQRCVRAYTVGCLWGSG